MAATSTAQIETVQIPVEGMTCASCVARVQKGLSKVEGVTEASVNFATEKATVSYDPAVVDVGGLVATVKDAGYDVQSDKLIVDIGGMTCASCVKRVEKALSPHARGTERHRQFRYGIGHRGVPPRRCVPFRSPPCGGGGRLHHPGARSRH